MWLLFAQFPTNTLGMAIWPKLILSLHSKIPNFAAFPIIIEIWQLCAQYPSNAADRTISPSMQLPQGLSASNFN